MDPNKSLQRLIASANANNLTFTSNGDHNSASVDDVACSPVGVASSPLGVAFSLVGVTSASIGVVSSPVGVTSSPVGVATNSTPCLVDEDAGVPPRLFKKKRKRKFDVSKFDRSKVINVLHNNPNMKMFLDANKEFTKKLGWELSEQEESELKLDHNAPLTLASFESLYGYKRLDVGDGKTISPFMLVEVELNKNIVI